jgi:hypothetical protein
MMAIIGYNRGMILTKKEPFTKDEILKLRERFDVYIKTVIDINRGICSAGSDRHFEMEKILLDQDSQQSDLWGGGLDIDTKTIDGNSFINIRPADANTSNEIQNPESRKKFETLMSSFFQEVL